MPYLFNVLIRSTLAMVGISLCGLTLAETPDSAPQTAGSLMRPFLGLGSQGMVLAGAFQVSPSFDARVVYSSINLNKTKPASTSATGSMDVKISNLSLLADWFPSDNSGWRLTGGIQSGTNKLTLSGTQNGTVNIGGTNYTNVKASATVDLGNTAPYIGFGYSTRSNKEDGFTFFNDVGIRIGRPQFTLTESTGQASQADLDAEKARIENKIKVLKYYPVVSLGLGYRW